MWGKVIRTISYLKFRQLFYQIWYRLIKPGFVAIEAPVASLPQLRTTPISKACCINEDRFTFLNREIKFSGWNCTDFGMLWAYNQNYFDWINQSKINVDECCSWIDRFIDELNGNKVGLDPYPTALRSINWIKFLCQHPECVTKVRLDSLYSQIMLLDRKLEYHLMANHLLEDAFALYIGAKFFCDDVLIDKAYRLLSSQLKEQILSDGAHYEQSPMYHCIILDRLLDCINISKECEEWLETYANRMLGHLQSIIWSNGDIPLLNDSANGIAPTPLQIFEYAKRLNLKWDTIPMKDCGYRKMYGCGIEAIVDIGNVTADYQPGHTHADTFNYELRIDGKPFVVDTGVSTYDKTERRQMERSTIAHNTVSVGGENSSEVWGGFRVGKRCHVNITEITDTSIEASHNGFEKKCCRRFEIKNGAFLVNDKYDGEAVSYIHLAEGVDEKHITIEGADKIEVKPWKYSTTYNQFRDGKVIEICFKGELRYTIQ